MSDRSTQLVLTMVKQGTLQRTLFKYRPINKHFEDILTSNRLWFSSPALFNDPFDCNIEIDINNSREEVRRYIEASMPDDTPGAKIDALVQTARYDPKMFHQFVIDNTRKVLESRGVACFSRTNNDLQEWSHYSDCHRGVCLAFDILKDPAFFVTPLNVVYQEDYMEYNHLAGLQELVTPLIETKWLGWQYEQEVRILKAHGYHAFEKQALTEIVFGWRTPEAEITRIKHLAQAYHYDHLVFKRAVLVKKQFGLLIKRI